MPTKVERGRGQVTNGWRRAVKGLGGPSRGIIWEKCMLRLPVPNPQEGSICPDLATGGRSKHGEVTIHGRFLKTALEQATKEVTGTADLPSPPPGLMT